MSQTLPLLRGLLYWKYFAKIKIGSVILSIGCGELVLVIFQIFWNVIDEAYSENVITSVLSIMSSIFNEGDHISKLLFANLLDVWRVEPDVSPMAHKLSKRLVK